MLLAAACAAPPQQQAEPIVLPAKPGIRVMSDCVIERHVQEVEGLRLVTWVVRPPGEGPFPIVVWNHGSRIPLDSWFGSDRTADPTIDFDRPCPLEVTRERWMYVYPEGRGYGGSEGPRLAPLLGDTAAVTRYLHGRAVDANAAARLIQLRPDARRHCAAIGGVSHGGVTALFAAADAPQQYRAVIVQATGICYRAPCGRPALEAAADAVEGPLLVQHFVTDSRCRSPSRG